MPGGFGCGAWTINGVGAAADSEGAVGAVGLTGQKEANPTVISEAARTAGKTHRGVA